MPSWSSVVKGSTYSRAEAVPAAADVPIVDNDPVPDSVWNELPPNFVCEVVRQLLSVHNDSLRSISQVSKIWACAARQATRSLVFRASLSRVCAKVAALSFLRRAGSFCTSAVTFELEQPLNLENLATLVDDLQHQLELLVPEAPLDPLDEWIAAQLTDKILLLFKEHDVTLRVTVGRGASAPLPETLAMLAGFLSQIDYYSVPRQHAKPIQPLRAATSVSFAAAHLNALSNSSILLTACAVTLHKDLAEGIGLKCLAHLTNLTKLHLTDTHDHRPDRQLLRPLGQLSLLSDLVLQCPEVNTCCKDVLKSSRHSLRSVDLNASSWSTATYNSLRQLSQLEFLAVNIGNLSVDQANEMACIRANLFSLCYSLNYDELDRPDGFKPLQALHSQKAELHELVLEACSDELLSYINLPTLTNLILEPHHVLECTTTSLQSHTNVRHLTFRSWHGMSGSHMEQLFHSLPALTGLSFCSFISPNADPDTTLYQWCWHVLPCAHGLQMVDLRGLHGLTEQSISRLCAAFREAQAAKTAHPEIQLLVPFRLLRHHRGRASPILESVCIGNVRRVYGVHRSYYIQLTITKDKP